MRTMEEKFTFYAHVKHTNVGTIGVRKMVYKKERQPTLGNTKMCYKNWNRIYPVLLLCYIMTYVNLFFVHLLSGQTYHSNLTRV